MANVLERQKHILDFTLSALFRKKGKNASLLLVYTLIVFMLASAIFFTDAVKREARIVLKNTPEMIVQRSVAGRRTLIPPGYREKIQDIRGVDSLRGRLWGYYYDSVVGANYTLMVPQDFPYGPGNITIGQGIARTRLAFPGDTLELRAFDGSLVTLEVNDVLPAESELVSSDLMLVSENDFRQLFGIPENHVTDFVVGIRNPREVSTIALKVSELLPDTRIVLREEILRTYNDIFDWRGGMMIFLLAVALLAFIIVAWDKASGLSQEEKKEIGVLKAIGWETSDVVLLKFWEGLVISLSSFLTGTILAYGHVFYAKAVLLEAALKGWAVLYPDFSLIPSIDAFQISILFFLTVVPYTVATVIPSWTAAIIDPDTVMRAS